jgi:hypothetical protein
MIPVFQKAFLKGRGTQFLGVLYVFIAKGRYFAHITFTIGKCVRNILSN